MIATPSSRTEIALVGHWRTAATTSSLGAPAGSVTVAIESSSSSNAPGATKVQLPDPMHLSVSIAMSSAMANERTAPNHHRTCDMESS